MKRFYETVTVREEDGSGWRVWLDERAMKTQGGAAQVVPTKGLAEMLAAEWAAQGEKVDPRSLPARDLADFAIDRVAQGRDEAIEDMLKYAGTDTLCYRADPDEPLHVRQQELWEPLLEKAEARLGVSFRRVSGIVHKPQPDETLAKLRAMLEDQSEFTLAAGTMLTSLAASLVIALEALEPDADAEALWTAANLEEDWQAELWGRDAEAETRRQARYEAFAMALRFAALARRPYEET